ncbi:MAG: hypothetical protein E7558_04570 [Ruminococcaceae bacterium]|nr:hypothetical protein [Oscillospiraceae bacterium]
MAIRAKQIKYKITNPYQSVEKLLSDADCHYKTNLHTHSTYSDANDSMVEMIEGFYDYDFDILAFAEHGILGKEWDKEPTIILLYLFQNLWHGKREHLSPTQYDAILKGTYKTKHGKRTKARGLMCVPGAIEANMLTLVKNHVNGYFTDNRCEGVFGKENDFEDPIRKIEESGGLSHINHPTDWLNARKYPDCAHKEGNINIFADLLRRYKSCLGIEVLNMCDIPNFCDRQLWDELLQVIIPEGERCVWGFGNSDAHEAWQADTAFMDYILPEYSLENLRSAMEKGNFFAVGRYAKPELGEDFEGKGSYPVVTEIKVNEKKNTITVTGENCRCIEWIANGKVISSDCNEEKGKIKSVINLSQHSDDITCYVRFQLKGDGGITLSQPFICDDGNMESLKKEPPKPEKLSKKDELLKKFYNTRIGVLVDRDKAYEV